MTVISKIASVSLTQMAKYLGFQYFSFPTSKEFESLVSDMSVVFVLLTEAARYNSAIGIYIKAVFHKRII